ncbi:hypothetical protein BS17DRAFT_791773 [Gyrodon lividus]|nr:hypothetical protein BS17DRAFT_791773 [Gyrodon lividus]
MITNPTDDTGPRPNYRVLVIVGLDYGRGVSWCCLGSLYLPGHAAHWVRDNTASVALIATIIATILSVITSL